ncbi:MAG TPA: Ig-like domain-containing protein, partial [Gemmatimonadales bacterium]|nr:Ig-like domain-containing protein [Gemmatimonadales bacterium]
EADSNIATVSLTINAVNDAPVATNDSFSLNEDAILTVGAPGVLGNDADVDDPTLSALLVTGPAHGTLIFNSDGSFTYTPAVNFNGADSFTYQANDGEADSNIATVSLTINAVNDAPVLAAIGNKTVDEQTLLTFTAGAVDVDSETLVFSLDTGAPAGAAIDPSSGVFTWTPTAAQGPGSYQVTVRVSDNGTPALDDFETITIVVNDAATGGIDLVGAVEWDPDDLLIPGDHEHVTVVVSNIGDTAVHQQVKVKIYASTDAVFDVSDVFLDTSHTGANIQPGASKAAQANFAFPSTLLPGHYFLLAVVDPDNHIAESNESNNTAVGEEFDFRWMFGSVPGHGREMLTVRDADGTKVVFALTGPGTGEVTADENGDWDLVVTDTSGKSVLSILTLGGGDNRVELDDIHVTGALGGVLAPKMDLTGTLAVEGALGAGMVIGSATDAVIAAQTILGTCLGGFSVQGIAILGDLENSEILIGADLGADGQLGGSGADADTYSGGDLGDLLITGSMISSSIRVGQDPVDGIFDNGDDVLLDGSIDSIRIYGEMSDDSFFAADDLPLYARIEGARVNTETDPRFIDSLPASGGDPECGIDWNTNAGCGWGAGCSPFGSRSGAGYSNFSDFLIR